MNEVRLLDLQRRMVSHMTSQSWKTIPHVSYLYEPDITDFYEEYLLLAEEKRRAGKKLSFNTLMLRTVVEGLKAAPELNAEIRYSHRKDEGTLRVRSDINISIPWLLPDRRMITPVLLHAQSQTLDGLSRSIAETGERIRNTNIDELLYRAAFADTVAELKKFHLGILKRIVASQVSFHRVRGLSGKEKDAYYRIPESRRLSEENLISGTVTVSNIGSLYREQQGFFALLEIIPPQVLAVGLGAVLEKPGVFTDGGGRKQIGIRKILPMCLAFDHRAVDFSSLVPFLKRLDGIFADPQKMRKW